MLEIVISNNHDPYTNVAIEHYLLKEAKDNDLLYLWENNPCVVFGRNQNIYAECDLAYMRENKISPVRRFSGGGAVFQDLGNVNYTFITSKEDDSKLKEILEETFKRLNIEIKFSGRNDILVNDKKISGYAYLADYDHYMFHGTMLIDVDFNKLKYALTPSKLKLESKGIKSVSQRVINLKEIDCKITNEVFKESMIKVSEEYYIDTTRKEVTINEDIKKIIKKLKSKEWLYNDMPNFDVSYAFKTKHGLYEIKLMIDNGIIKDLDIRTDDLSNERIDYLNKSLKNLSFDYESIEKYILSVLV